MALESWVLRHQLLLTDSSSRLPFISLPKRITPIKVTLATTNTAHPFPSLSTSFILSSYTSSPADTKLFGRTRCCLLRCLGSGTSSCSDSLSGTSSVSKVNLNFVHGLLNRGIILAATVCGVLVFGCRRVLAVEGVLNGGYGVIDQSMLLLRSTWPKVLPVLRMFKEHGLVLPLLLSLSAFFSMAETSITTI